MAINKDKIKDLVEIFYQAPFKTFFINSLDGESFVKHYAVFVSLGITTSLGVIKDIKNVLKRVEGGKYSTKIVILKSTNISGQFLNYPIDCDEETLEQFSMNPKEYPSEYWKKDEAHKLLQEYKDKKNENYISQLEKLITKIETAPTGWDNVFIYQESPSNFGIFHTRVNYKKETDGSEYRIGIYVEETNN